MSGLDALALAEVISGGDPVQYALVSRLLPELLERDAVLCAKLRRAADPTAAAQLAQESLVVWLRSQRRWLEEEKQRVETTSSGGGGVSPLEQPSGTAAAAPLSSSATAAAAAVAAAEAKYGGGRGDHVHVSRHGSVSIRSGLDYAAALPSEQASYAQSSSPATPASAMRSAESKRSHDGDGDGGDDVRTSTGSSAATKVATDNENDATVVATASGRSPVHQVRISRNGSVSIHGARASPAAPWDSSPPGQSRRSTSPLPLPLPTPTSEARSLAAELEQQQQNQNQNSASGGQLPESSTSMDEIDRVRAGRARARTRIKEHNRLKQQQHHHHSSVNSVVSSQPQPRTTRSTPQQIWQHRRVVRASSSMRKRSSPHRPAAAAKKQLRGTTHVRIPIEAAAEAGAPAPRDSLRLSSAASRSYRDANDISRDGTFIFSF